MKITKLFFYLEALFFKITSLHKNIIFQSLQTCEGNTVKWVLKNKLNKICFTTLFIITANRDCLFSDLWQLIYAEHII